MPNWCMNTLNVEGPAEDVKKFRMQARGHTQSYNEFSPHTVDAWPINDDIRLESLISNPPEPGDIVDLSFHALYPVPEDFRCFPYDDTRAKELGELVGQTRPHGGYQWESKHWGVKWGGCDTSLDTSEDNLLQYSFSTPWGPPLAFFEKVAADWPSLSFTVTFEEPGMGFRGEYVWEDGGLVFEYEEEYSEEEEE